MLLQRLSPTGALVSVGLAAAGVGWLMWQLARPRPPAPQLSLADRQEKLRAAEAMFHRQFPNVPLVHAAQAHQLLQQQPDKFVLVDCRNKEEQEVSMVPGSRVLSRSAFEAQAVSNQDVTAICMCTVGYRSSLYAQQLISQGWAAANLAGGILSWTHEGLPLVDPSQAPTNRVHTYSSDWAWQGDGYAPVSYHHSLLVLARDVVRDTVKGILSRGTTLGKTARQ